MWICNAQYQHCELCHLSKVALIVLYNVSDQGASVGESVNASGCVVSSSLSAGHVTIASN